MKYHLIHITTGGEFKTPLVASQLFDQAEVQAITSGPTAPVSVGAWAIEPMRLVWNKSVSAYLMSLRKRCPAVQIHLIGGISRLSNFPAGLCMLWLRLLKGRTPVVYHCRGESALAKVLFLKKIFKSDRFVLDVRGHWPAELVYQHGITDLTQLEGEMLIRYRGEEQKLRAAISEANAVSTVSDNLRDILIKEYGAGTSTTVVPCCVKNIVDRTHREIIRKQLGFSPEDIVLVYSGTTAAYQHLADLTLPFLKRVAEQSARIKILLLTPDPLEMSKLIQYAAIPAHQYKLISLRQEEVGRYLTAGDIGILIRKPTLVNKVAQPVKIAEYLAAGLRMLVESESVGISPELIENQVVYCIHSVQHQDKTVADRDVKAVLSFIEQENSSGSSQKYVQLNYIWEQAIVKHRVTYQSIL